MKVTVQCSHYILGRCKEKECPWSKPQRVKLDMDDDMRDDSDADNL